MHDLNKRLAALQTALDEAWAKLALDQKLAEVSALEAEVAEPEIWANPENAKTKNEQLARLREQTEPWTILRAQAFDISELLDLADDTLSEEISAQLSALEQELSVLKQTLRFTGPHDHGDAILRITSGAGGTEAMDWAAMLERMYLRWAASEGFKTHTLDRTPGEEAGLKTVVIEITGPDAYGRLKSEHGTHRLVRLSPFNADHLRQTSFAGVEVLPLIIPDTSAVKIPEKDLRIDVYRAGGHGGQSVNTTDSAVRITHLPTGIVVAIQNERSQLQNREKAMEILLGKLEQLRTEQNAESIDSLRSGESASWGQQIRNYILHPYKLVKDTRTGHEETDTDNVLDGAINPFIDAYLSM
ncbi:peptide chain release factor 2 [Christensenellaceae bacterium OttesenSCG-928-L17]|nr:peptide chain release factor 2 [Christensenellaceae bacterium OttesenSCG-928-L17]